MNHDESLRAWEPNSPSHQAQVRRAQFEIAELRECGLRDCWVNVDLRHDPEQLATLPSRAGVQSPMTHHLLQEER
jgi:hypothetical protein